MTELSEINRGTGKKGGEMIVDGEKLRRLCKNWYWKDGHVSLTWGELLGAVKSCEVKIQPPAKIEAAIKAVIREAPIPDHAIAIGTQSMILREVTNFFRDGMMGRNETKK